MKQVRLFQYEKNYVQESDTVKRKNWLAKKTVLGFYFLKL